MLSTAQMQASLSGLERACDLARFFAGKVRERFGGRAIDVRLFGSAARGDWMEGSDVDILILLDKVEKIDADWLIQEAFHEGVMERNITIQPVFMTAADFQKLRDRERLLARDIDREGLPL